MSWPRRSIEAGAWLLTACLAAVALVGAFSREAVVMYGESCTSHGTCASLERTYRLGLDFGWFSAAYVAGAALVLLIGVFGVTGRLPLAVGAVAIVLAVVATLHMESMTHGCWFGPGVGDCYADPVAHPEAYGPFRQPHAVEVANVVRSRVPHGTVTVGVEPTVGWEWFYRAAYAVLLLATIGLAVRLLSAPLALVAGGTAALVVAGWVGSTRGGEWAGASLIFALAVSACIWVLYGFGHLVVRAVARARTY